MFYGIGQDWKLCGWKRLPFALSDSSSGMTLFFDREQYSFLLKCDGKHDLESGSFSVRTQEMIRRLVEKGAVIESETEIQMDLPAYTAYPTGFRKVAHWSITGSCNYRCRHCLMSAPYGRFPHPSFEQLLMIADQLEECGVHRVSLTGGEPLIRKDFLELADALADRGIHIAMLFTNGELVTRKLLEELKRRSIHCDFQISFDGTGGWHDWMRGIDGAGLSVERAIRLCVEEGFKVSCAMCLHKNNVSVLRESVQYLAALGVDSLKVSAASAEGEWKKHPELFLSAKELFRVFLDYIPQYFEDDCPLKIELDAFFIYDQSSANYYNGFQRDSWFTPENCLVCNSTKQNFYIGSDGSVVPCMSMAGNPVAKHFYNLYETELKEILDHSNLTRAGDVKFHEMIVHNPECAACGYTDVCRGGCRARATTDLYDDYLRPEPITCEFFKGEWRDKIHEACDAAFDAYRHRRGIR